MNLGKTGFSADRSKSLHANDCENEGGGGRKASSAGGPGGHRGRWKRERGGETVWLRFVRGERRRKRATETPPPPMTSSSRQMASEEGEEEEEGF